MKLSILFFTVFLSFPFLSLAEVYTYNFDQDQSQHFTVYEYQGPDSTIDWTYDYSTHVQMQPYIDVPITSAPHSNGTTSGIKISVNESIGNQNGVLLFPQLDDYNGGNWVMTFDVWANHNGDAFGNAGPTEFLLFGAQDSQTEMGLEFGNAGGFIYLISGDGGSSNDARYFSGNPMVYHVYTPAWFNGSPPNNNNLDEDWVNFFPNDGTLGTSPVNTVAPGAIGKKWVTIRLSAKYHGAIREVAFKRSSDLDFTVVSTIIMDEGAYSYPCIGYVDLFSSVASEPEDQFIVFDNLVIETPPPNPDGWMLE